MNLQHYFQLVSYKAFAELKEEVSKNYLGILWWMLDPVLYMGVFYLVFEMLPIRNRPEGFVSFLLVGLIVWRWFQTGLVTGALSIIMNKSIMQLVYVPKIIFPIGTIITSTFKFLLTFILLMTFLFSQGFEASFAYLYLPILLLVELSLITGLAFWLSLVVPMVPDLKIVIQRGLHLAFLLSGIFFDGSQLQPKHQTYFYLNPMANLVEGFRDVILYSINPDLEALTIIMCFSSFMILTGILMHLYLDKKIPKIVATL